MLNVGCTQAFIMVLLDLTLCNVVEIGWNAAYNFCITQKHRRRKAAAEAAAAASAAYLLNAKPATRASRHGNDAEAGKGSPGQGPSEGGTSDAPAAGEAEGEDELASEIELTDDYVELLYRQYVMLMCLCVFPLIAALTLLCNLLEWPLDKLKFIKLSNPRIRGRFHRSTAHLAGFAVLVAAAGFAHFPTGPIWCVPPQLLACAHAR